MKPFAQLLERLLLTPQRGVKQRLIQDYIAHVPDPDRGWGLAALTGALSFREAKPGLVRALAEARTDAVLFAWSYDFVGDLADTVSLIWPAAPGADDDEWPRLGEVVTTLGSAPKSQLPAVLGAWLDHLDPAGRWALLKLVTGSLRVGASARLATLALAAYGKVEPALVEEAWHCTSPPYGPLLDWIEGRGPRPDGEGAPAFRPLMLAHPLEEEDVLKLAPELDRFSVEWKWDGIRVQIVAAPGGVRLYSRSGEDVSQAFPELLEPVSWTAVLDGELLVGRAASDLTMLGRAASDLTMPGAAGEEGEVRSFNELQQRLNRKAPTSAMLERYPAFVRLYDILAEGGEDLRPLPFLERRRRLEAFWARLRPHRMDLSPLVPPVGLEALDALRREARGTAREGLMLKRKDSAYQAGRPKGLWWKWKRDVHLLDCVMMYAQRAHGKRSSFYSDYTFGVWRDGDGGAELVPVGKAYSGFTDEELRRLDAYVRDRTTARFGPVREVAHKDGEGLVLEIAFDSVHPSTRHKSGVAMRFPRVARIRWDKPAAEADRLETVLKLIEGDPA